VGLANNHALDQGASGLDRSLAELRHHRIASFGAGRDLASAEAPLVRRIKLPGGDTLTLAVFGMFEERPQYRKQFGFYASEGRLGTAALNVRRFRLQVAQFKRKHPAAFIVAFPHWGDNYSWTKRSQIATGRGLIEAGADMVIGQHGHTIQEIERYNGRWIFYGIGNLYFGSPGRYDRHLDVLPYSLVVQLGFRSKSASNTSILAYPISADNLGSRFTPAVVGASEAERILAVLQSKPRSRGLERAKLVRVPDGFAIQLAR
jgi:poly-gamma-glutamate capsule biosynthesis protein CapA/YwtB (metallophosphatase superfamily)